MSTLGAPVIDVRDLHMSYGATEVLRGIDLTLRAGEVVALLGPNGAGKTTTIEILEGFRSPSAGHVRVLGREPMHAGEAWRARVGIVLQSWRDHPRWRTPAVLGWTSLVLYGTLAISGIFYPLSALPGWLQVIGRILPTYWLGLGLRSALLPPGAVALEAGQSWHSWETAAVLGAWTVAGLVLAPIALRRMARRQSGSQVAAARARFIARGY